MIRTLILALAALLSVSACNTVQGMGRDLSAAGTAMSDTAGDVKHRM